MYAFPNARQQARQRARRVATAVEHPVACGLPGCLVYEIPPAAEFGYVARAGDRVRADETLNATAIGQRDRSDAERIRNACDERAVVFGRHAP